MKRYLHWALANIQALANVESDRAEDVVHDAYWSASGEVILILVIAFIPYVILGRELLIPMFDSTTVNATLAALFPFLVARPVDWYIKRRIAAIASSSLDDGN